MTQSVSVAAIGVAAALVAAAGDVLEYGDALLGAGWVAALVAAVYVGRSRGKDALIETQARQITALRDEVEDSERRRTTEVKELTDRIATLEGRVGALAEQQGAAIGAVIAPVVADRLASVVLKALDERKHA